MVFFKQRKLSIWKFKQLKKFVKLFLFYGKDFKKIGQMIEKSVF
jgi:hypothetical protein